MKINPITNRPFTLLELSQVATNFYDAYRSKQIISGFERCVCTDGQYTMFVLPNYKPQSPDEVVFFCSVRRGCNALLEVHGTGTMLYRTYTEGPKDPVLNGVDTDEATLIRAAHKAMNPKFYAQGHRVCYHSRWYILEDLVPELKGRHV